MNNTIAARIESLSMTEGERNKALAYMSAGNTIADVIVAIMGLFHVPATLRTAS